MKNLPTINIADVLRLRRANHSVYGYVLKGIISVDGFKEYRASAHTCMLANAPASELDELERRWEI